MLNGIDPIILFNFFKLTPQVQASLSQIPIVSDIVSKVPFAPIPIYLSERLTGLSIESEDKSIDIDTTNETATNGADPLIFQKGLNSTVRINLIASRNSIGVTLISALADQIFKKVTSKEYSITYLHGAVTVFNGLLNSFNITQNSDNDLYNITIELVRPGVSTVEKAPIPVVSGVSDAVLLGG
jgi:hypothetical protein